MKDVRQALSNNTIMANTQHPLSERCRAMLDKKQCPRGRARASSSSPSAGARLDRVPYTVPHRSLAAWPPMEERNFENLEITDELDVPRTGLLQR
ncbi:unnamed protein product, partial [Durusdinium trenchii]